MDTIEENLATGSQITAALHQEVEMTLLAYAKQIAESQWKTGDIKMIDCTDAYISANFESTGNFIGRGKNNSDREGWAICNGLNGTVNRTGRVPIGWGTATATDLNNTSITQSKMKNTDNSPVTLGTKEHTLGTSEIPAHSHGFPGEKDLGPFDNKDGWKNETLVSGTTTPINYDVPASTNQGGKIYKTTSIGSGQPHNNMQPSIVTLFIQKITFPYTS